MSILSENIRKLRKREQLTQEEFAAKIEVSASSILNWEKDKNEPTIFNCEVMADFFGVTLDELCRGEI